jgi:hypothetical protein
MYDRKSLIRLSIAALAGLAAGTAPILAVAEPGPQKAKISMREARTIALKAYPGMIMKEELEHAVAAAYVTRSICATVGVGAKWASTRSPGASSKTQAKALIRRINPHCGEPEMRKRRFALSLRDTRTRRPCP